MMLLVTRILSSFVIGLLALAPAHADWAQARPGWVYEFPRDEFSHPDFKTEWWYFTGNLREAGSGRRFGYQLTFFRQGIRPPGARPPAASKFVTDHFWFAHFAISDLEGKTFHAKEIARRGAFDEAGSGMPSEDPRLAWIGDWSLAMAQTGSYVLHASTDDLSLDLELSSGHPPIFHGANGISAKSPDIRNASHYYSHPRLASTGRIRIGSRTFEVEGQSWFDREWSTSVLGKDMAGWDWFSIQFDGGGELMLFQLRGHDGTAAFTSGTMIAADGRSQSLENGAIQLTPLRRWKPDRTGAEYPVEWRAEVPGLDLTLTVKAAMPDQELRLAAVTYWEGATTVEGTRSGQPIRGLGYLEMTGYRSALGALR
jgi:predicted secreted hydrolase